MKRLSTLFCLILIVLSSIISCRMDESLVWSSFLDKTDTRTEEEVFEQAAKNLVSVAKAVDPFFLESGSAAEMSEHLEEIKKIEGVVDAYSTTSSVFVKIKDWGTIGYCFDSYDNERNLNLEAIDQIKSKFSNLPSSKSAAKTRGNYSACIMNAQHQERIWTREVTSATEEMFEKTGIEVKVFNNPTLDFFQEDIFDYNLVFVIAHGSYDDVTDSHWIQTSEKVKADNLISDFRNTFISLWHYLIKTDQVRFIAFQNDNYGNDKTVFRYTISEAYINNSSKSFNGSGEAVLFMVPCQSLMGKSSDIKKENTYVHEGRLINDSMAQAFFDKGAGMYIGYDESSSNLAQYGGMRFFANLLSGESFENALIMPDSDDVLKVKRKSDPGDSYTYEHMKDDREWYVARHVLTDNGFQMDAFIISPKMNMEEQDSVSDYWLSADAYYSPECTINNYNFTFVDDDRLEYGFSVGTGTNPSSGTHYSAYSSRNSSTHIVNYSYRLPFSTLTPYTEYHIWPYIADGGSYNYGNGVTLTTGSLTVPVSGVVLDKTFLTLNVGENATLRAAVLPTNATNKEVTWSSDKESVATVSSNGEVTAVTPGTAVITATTVDGGFTATCTVEVKPIPIDLTVTTLDATDIAIKKATVSGEYLYDGAGLNIHEQGFVISSTVQNPALSMSGCRSIAAEKTGTSFSATITGLEPLTQYYVAAYMVVVLPYGERQTFYGNVVSFVTDPIKNVIPDEIVDQMDDYMPIHNGINPPVIEGQYVVSPNILVYSTHGFSPGDKFADYYVMFYNQDIINNTLDFRAAEKFDDGSSSGTGTGAFISGEGNDFSVFFNVDEETVYSDYTIYTKKAVIISGTMTDNGIKDLYHAFVMLEKSSDPKSHLVPVGTYRVFKDKDGLSAFTNFFFTKASNRTRVLQNSPKKLPCISTSANEP